MLGPLEASIGGAVLSLGGPRQNVVLAVLLDRRNTVVPRNRLIADLWGDEPPDSAEAALHNAISQLRRALEPDRAAGTPGRILETRGSGYILHVAPGQLDLDAVDRLRAATRTAREAGDADGAAGALNDALALWRGEPLAGLEGDAAAGIAARLASLRLDLEEDLADIELDRHRHRAIVRPLAGLVEANPLRARLRAQLMLALYRAGRQTEALEVYRAGHRAFADVGLEPDPSLQRLERDILAHAPELDAGEPPRPAGPRRPTRRRLLVAAGGAALALAVAGAAMGLRNGDDPPPESAAAAITGDRVIGIDTRSARVVAELPVGHTPTSAAADAKAIWVLNADDATITRVDLATRTSETFGAGGVPTDLAIGEGAVWVANGRRQASQFIGPIADQISRVDAVTHALAVTTALPRRRSLTSNASLGHVVVAAGAVWTIAPDYRVIRLDPATARITAEIDGVVATALASGDVGLWALEAGGTVVQLDESSGKPGRRIAIKARDLDSIAVGAGAVWTTDAVGGVLWRIDPQAPKPVPQPIALAPGIGAVAADAAGIWVVNAGAGTVSRVDPSSNRLSQTVRVAATPRRLALAGSTLWVTAQAHAALTDGALPARRCGEVVFAGGGRPDALIVSDLPMRAGLRVPTEHMRDAVTQVLAESGFRAGALRIGYQACDDSTGQRAVFDEQTCIANARMYAAAPIVIGVVGPYNSGCAVQQIPITNGAPGGPLAMVSPTASMIGLTRGSESDLRELYPTGIRSFARLFGGDDVQGEVLARRAHDLGARRAVLVSDGADGEPAAGAFATTAREIGLDVAQEIRVSPTDDPGAVARRVARSRPDAVLVAALIDSGAGGLVRSLRRVLGPRVTLLATDGVLPVSTFFESAGGEARGTLIAVPGIARERLGPTGQRFASRFAATHGGQPPDVTAIYAAAATQVLLDAIARSDGSRASVSRALPGTVLADSVLGAIALDPRGDLRAPSITIVRAERAGGSDVLLSSDGATIDRVMTGAPPGG
jgi:DNA-binding SARP family transcriptional activator/ABC-type branched-subunit amino acid transport system substrate-binding protein/DNA-binding beta-propeller fold protein YncE